MFREDIIFLIPALLIALLQAKVIWGRLPNANPQETEIKGEYNFWDNIKFNYLAYLAAFTFLIQLVIPLLPITNNETLIIILRLLGYILITFGFTISLKALKDLGENWTGMNEYRIKKGQQLIKTGIYKNIRHPIYSAVILETVGFELLANSWLAIIFLIILTFFFIHHIKKEEALLTQKFGAEYLEYKKNTKMLLPFLL